jgi:type I restriction enzyme S subunit
MNPELLLAQFNRISEAPDGIPRLRSFILDLAVRGKLVEQDPTDEPASQLFRRIQAEKAQLVKNGRISKQKPLPEIGDEELPFLVPSAWIWARLAGISRRIHYGFTASANPALKDVRLLRITDIQNNLVDWSSVPGCEISDHEVDQYKLQPGEILIARTGGTIGKTFLVSELPVTAVFASYLIRVQKSSEFIDRYLKLFLESPVYWKQLQDGARGGGQPNVNGQTLGKMTVALPPLAEQHRIVAKVDELMALCDRLEVVRGKRESRRDRLIAASFHQFNNGEGAEIFREHAKFHIGHLPLLTTRPDQIKQLRQTVLNLAVRGLVVPQDPKDELASRLLGERQVFLDSEAEPWKLPSGWAWSSFNLIGETLGGGTPSKTDSEFWRGSIPWVSPKDMKVDVIADTQDHISTLAIEQSAARLIPTGSLLMVVRGMILAHSFPTASTAVPVTINQDMKAIVPFRPDLIRFLLLLTKGLKPEVLRLVLRSTHGTCKLLTDDLFSLPIPIPPLAEQCRIVAKVYELMALCDRLETQLTTAETETSRLLESVLYHALNDKDAAALAALTVDPAEVHC